MQDNLFEIDKAMNMIKEDMIRDLSEAVTKKTNQAYCQEVPPANLSFSEKIKD